MQPHCFFTEDELATRWSTSKKVLRRWRKMNWGPKHTKFGNKVLYSFAAIVVFENPAIRALMRPTLTVHPPVVPRATK